MQAVRDLLFIPAVFITQGLVMLCAWNWAASPVFHVRHCTLLEALAVSVVISTQYVPKEDGRTVDEVLLALVVKYTLILIAAASVGWAAT